MGEGMYLGGEVAVQTGTVPLTGDRLGVEGDLGAELLGDAAGGCVSWFDVKGVMKGLGVVVGVRTTCGYSLKQETGWKHTVSKIDLVRSKGFEDRTYPSRGGRPSRYRDTNSSRQHIRARFQRTAVNSQVQPGTPTAQA
jgi:hypothetical protein